MRVVTGNKIRGFQMSSVEKLTVLIFGTVFLLMNCSQNKVPTKPFGVLEDGREINLYTISNSRGMTAEVINFGARIVSLKVADRQGNFEDVILGFDNLAAYEKDNSYQGAIVGRYGNRIGGAKFTLEGKTYRLDINDGANCLHGGKEGFDKKVWKCRQISPNVLKLSYVSPDGEGGFPGRVKVTVTYTITEDNELKIEYRGVTDKTTVLNPTSHCYFNLTGSPENDILDHELMIDADYFTPVDGGLIPTGEIRSVVDTPLDFLKPKKIGQHIDISNEQISFGSGYDHNWMLNGQPGQLRLSASLYDSQSGRMMEVLTDQAGLQFYSGNFLDGSMTGKHSIRYKHRTALCLEAQSFPDSPNKTNFPSVVLKPGEEYKQTTVYRFSIK